MTTFSQRGQDIFVIDTLKNKVGGTFLDFGCRGPIDINNTCLMEKNYGFSGLSFDIDAIEIAKWKESGRNFENAKVCDLLYNFDHAIQEIQKFYKSNVIDYFSFDLEPPLLTLEVLKKFPFDKYKFRVVTFEHDYYRGFNTLNPSREFFLKHGYRKIKAEVMFKFDFTNSINMSEDWWIHPDLISVPEDILDVFPSNP